jgi:hypothetical protein
VTEAVQIALIVAVGGAIVPSVTVVVTWAQTRKKVEKVHEIVNSQRTAMERSIARLETEIRRLNADPAHGTTPEAVAHVPVTLSAGGVVDSTDDRRAPANEA